jgi:hypothetical protein
MARVLVNLEELDLDTAALIEGAGQTKKLGMADARRIIASFLVADDGTPLSPEEALAFAGRLKLREVKDVIAQINAGMSEMNEAAVPKVTSSPS